MYLDDSFPASTAAVQVGPLACWLHVCALGWSNRTNAGGAVPFGVLPELAEIPDLRSLADRLVDAGLWEATADGWQIVAHRQPPPEPATRSRWERRIGR